MKPLRKAARSKSFFLLLLMFFIGGICQAQEKVTDYYSPAGKANLATLWHAPKIYFVGAPDPWDTFPEPFGFIGSNYQRFYIHYTFVTKNPSNPYQYLVKEKTRLKKHLQFYRYYYRYAG